MRRSLQKVRTFFRPIREQAASLKERAVERATTEGTRLFLYGSYFGLSVMMFLKVWPQKHYSERFFEVGKLYRFRPHNTWYTLWIEETGSDGTVRRIPSNRMKPGTVFIVLSTKTDIPTSLEVCALVEERRAFFSLVGEQSIQPWQYFERVQKTAGDDAADDITSEDLP